MRLLLLIDRPYPVEHAFLETVYSRLFPAEGNKVYWIMRSYDNNKFCEVKRWNNSIIFCFASPKNDRKVFYYLYNVIIAIASIKLIHRIRPDLIQVRNWVWGAFMAYLFKRVMKIPFSFQNTFPSEISLTENVKYGGFKLKIWSIFIRFFRKKLIQKADLILPISKEMKLEMIKQGYMEKKLYPVGLAFDSDINIEKIDNSDVVEKYCLKGKSVALYFGVLGSKRQLEFLLDIWSIVCDHVSDCVLLMVGGLSNDIQKLKQYAIDLKIEKNVIFTGFVSRKMIPAFIKSSIITISPIPPTPMYNVSSVTKLYESLGCGCPVVGNNLPEQGKVLRESKGGICVDYDKKQFSDAIIYLLNNIDLANHMGKAGKDYIMKNRTYRIVTKDLIGVYSKTL